MSRMRGERQTREDRATQPLDAGRLSFAILLFYCCICSLQRGGVLGWEYEAIHRI